ncbi:serine carboxypeptidase-like 17 [Durio zibethinus]|uniref:Serine carboxypeptidase-like 17 n=1 Tax=Durio zibethinus TaxID=66656 RepID=A0A6P5YMY3_DURZI|nr:serine carboxypeptidase-like 17 [Durio zibethinus]
MLVEILEQNLARMVSKHSQLVCFYIVLVMVWDRPAVSFSTISSLPGFSGSLPFKLETGYIGVGDVEFFYYFIESERNPAEDPVVLWLTGGPGCTALSGFFLEIGPLKFNMVEYNGSLPTFALNPYSWTKVANIIFLDAPVGTGFSYSRTFQGFKTGDKKFANDGYNFMRKWLQSHPKFITNPFYLAGDSYAGKIVPIIAQAISDGTEERGIPAINLKGYLIGNPRTDWRVEDNSKISFYHRMALISDELYESAKRNCKENYIEVDVSNLLCAKDLQAISECTADINVPHILEHNCPSDFRALGSLDNKRKYFLETHEDNLRVLAEFPKFGCRNYNCYLCKVWATDISVQKALHIRKGTVREWVRCNNSLLYDKDVENAVGYHLFLNTKGYRALIYSGDHDSGVPYVGTETWIKSLNFSIVDDWRPWFVDGQVAGYSREYENNFTFATIKGGGHTAPEFNPKECFGMFKRWISPERL